MPTFRGFISIDISENENINRILKELKSVNSSLKLVDAKNLHITLKFLGNTEESDVPKITKIIEKATDGISPFEVSLIGMGAFPSERKIRVIWIGIKDSSIISIIANRLDEELISLGYERERREFSPHLTLARAKEIISTNQLREIIAQHRYEDFGRESIRAVRLKKSLLKPEGPTYITIAERTFDRL